MATANVIGLAILCDYPIVREALTHVLSSHAHLQVCCGSLKEPALITADVDIVLCVLGGSNSVEDAVASVRQALPAAKLVCLFLEENDAGYLAAIRSGSNGIVDSNEDFSPMCGELCVRLEGVARGEFVIPAAIATRLAHMHALESRHLNGAPHPEPLTPREDEVLGLLKDGYSNRDIALQLSVSEHTVRAHLRGIMQKLQVSNRGQAAALAWRQSIPKARSRRELNGYSYR